MKFAPLDLIQVKYKILQLDSTKSKLFVHLGERGGNGSFGWVLPKKNGLGPLGVKEGEI